MINDDISTTLNDQPDPLSDRSGDVQPHVSTDVDKKKRRSKKDVASDFKDQPEVDTAVEKLKSEEGLDVKVKESAKYALKRAIKFINSNFTFRYNIINRELEFRLGGIDAKKDIKKVEFRTFENRDFVNLLVKAKLENVTLGKDMMKTVIESDQVSMPFNPFEDYLFNLPKWDERTDFLREYLSVITLEDEREREAFVLSFTKWFTNLVASLVTDGVVNQQCLVLVSKQGRFKTTWQNNLVPKKMQMEYLFSSKFNFENKDHFKYLGTKMLINLDELASLSRTDEGVLKTILTDDRVIMRLPYGSFDSKFYRKASFCGNSNNANFLKDETGNRRFLVFKIKGIELNPDLNVDNCYAQALALYKSGFRFWFDIEDIKSINERNTNFHDTSIEEELLRKYYRPPSDFDLRKNPQLIEYKSATELNLLITKDASKLNMNETTKRRLNQVLEKLGFKQKQMRLYDAKSPSRYWMVRPAEMQEYEMRDPDLVKVDLPEKADESTF